MLVTGASGFIGRHLLPACVSAGHEVHAVSSRGRPSRDRGARRQDAHGEVRWHRGDLLEPAAAAALVAGIRPELLVHLAWSVEHERFWSSPENVRWVESSLALVRAFAAAGGRRAVIAGTCAEYDWERIGRVRADHQPPRCHELRTPTDPRTLYGACKRALNAVAERFAATAGIEVCHGRVFFLYGPGEQPGRLVAQVASALLAGERVATGDGRQVRDFLYVQDVADAFRALAESDVLGAVNIGSGEPVTVGGIVEAIAEQVGRPELVEWGARPRPEGDPDALLADVRRLRREVGFGARVTLADGLAATVQWCAEQKHVRLARTSRR